jgi:hypothetical protein
MAKDKQHVFSARTTEEGLGLLNGIREEKKIGWDELVIDAVCAHYGLDRLVMALPKAYRPEKKAVAKGKKSGKGAKARKPKVVKEKKPTAETTEETQAQQA